jgi:hypothetical protein
LKPCFNHRDHDACRAVSRPASCPLLQFPVTSTIEGEQFLAIHPLDIFRDITKTTVLYKIATTLFQSLRPWKPYRQNCCKKSFRISLVPTSSPYDSQISISLRLRHHMSSHFSISQASHGRNGMMSSASRT